MNSFHMRWSILKNYIDGSASPLVVDKSITLASTKLSPNRQSDSLNFMSGRVASTHIRLYFFKICTSDIRDMTYLYIIDK